MSIALILQLLGMAFDAVEELATNKTLKTAAEIADALVKITGAVTAATSGTVTPDVARAQITRLMAELRANDAAADAALAGRFPGSTP